MRGGAPPRRGRNRCARLLSFLMRDADGTHLPFDFRHVSEAPLPTPHPNPKTKTPASKTDASCCERHKGLDVTHGVWSRSLLDPGSYLLRSWTVDRGCACGLRSTSWDLASRLVFNGNFTSFWLLPSASRAWLDFLQTVYHNNTPRYSVHSTPHTRELRNKI